MSLDINYNIKDKIDNINTKNTAKSYYEFIDYLISSKHRSSTLCINFTKYSEEYDRYCLEFCIDGIEKELSPNNFENLFKDVNKMAGHPYLNALVATSDSYNSTGIVINLKNTQKYQDISKYKTTINIRNKNTFSSVNSEFNNDLKDSSGSGYKLKYVIPVSRNNVIRIGLIIRNSIPRFNKTIKYNVKDISKNS